MEKLIRFAWVLTRSIQEEAAPSLEGQVRAPFKAADYYQIYEVLFGFKARVAKAYPEVKHMRVNTVNFETEFA